MKHTAYFAFGLLGLIWGTNFIFMKWAADLITPGQIVFLRVLFGFLPILLFAVLSRSLRWSHLRYAHHFLVMALLATAIYYYAFAKGTSLLLSSVAGMLSGAIPLFTFVCSLLFLRQEPLNGRTSLGVVFGFLGVLLIARPWEAAASGINLEGVLYMVMGSLSVGCSFVYAKRFLTGLTMSPLALCTYQIGFALVVIAAVTDLQGIERIAEDARAFAGVSLGLGLLGTGLAYILYYFIVQRLGALAASAVTYIPPVVALLIGYFLVHEPVSAVDLVAVVAIIGGVYILQTGKRQAPANSVPVVGVD
ncbi:membrane protein [Pseudomonas taeanensis MS-3]|uniref:Membrane protein n=1 Tax=Pseudomonas taeanensis MS-3 TaxID=1395571 RepID=A0A0A1YKW4_9PSED|nr:DMT family transporter [Pseudomonas taeanensis]KFX69726.1 membrane protein [Pseudomonas taeanensis MS-3]